MMVQQLNNSSIATLFQHQLQKQQKQNLLGKFAFSTSFEKIEQKSGITKGGKRGRKQQNRTSLKQQQQQQGERQGKGIEKEYGIPDFQKDEMDYQYANFQEDSADLEQQMHAKLNQKFLDQDKEAKLKQEKNEQEWRRQFQINQNSYLDSEEAILHQLESSRVTLHVNMSLGQALYCGKLFARVNYKQSEEWQQIISCIQNHLQQIDKVNITEVLWILGKSGERNANSQLYEELQQMVLDNIEYLHTDDLSIITWSYAKYKNGDTKFWNSIILQLINTVQKMNQVDVSNTCWSLQKIEDKYESLPHLPKLWEEISKKIMLNIDMFQDEQSFSIIISSIAKAKQGSSAFWTQMGIKFEQMAPRLSNMGIANSIWALGNKNLFEIERWLSIEQVIIQRMEQIKFKEVIAVSWGCLRMEMGTKKLWEELLNKIEKFMREQSLEEMDYFSLSTCSHIFNQIQSESQDRWKVLEEVLLQKLQQQENQNEVLEVSHFTTILCAFANQKKGGEVLWQLFEKEAIKYFAGHEPESQQQQLYEGGMEYQQQQQLEQLSQKKKTKFDAKIVANIIYGFTMNGKVSRKLLDLFADSLQGNIEHMSMQGILVSFRGLIKCGGINKFLIERNARVAEITDEFIEVIYERREQFEMSQPRDLGMLLYSCAKMQYRNNDLLQQLLAFFEQKLLAFLQEFQLPLTPDQIQKNLQNIDFQEQEKMMRNLRQFIGQLDLAHIVMGFDSYNVANPLLWARLEHIALLYLNELQEQNASIILRIGAKRFSAHFFEQFQEVIRTHIKLYRPVMLVNIINSYRNNDLVSQESFLVLEKNILLRFAKNELSLPEACNILQSFAKTDMGTHQFWFQCGQIILNQFKSNLIKINLNDVNERGVFCSLLEVAAANIQFRNNQELYNIIIQGSKQIIISKYLKIRELNTFISCFSQLKFGDNAIWGILEQKVNYFKEKMSTKALMKLLIKMKQIRRGSPSLYDKSFEYLGSVIDQVSIDLLQHHCLTPSPLQQEFYRLYVKKITSQAEEDFDEYIALLHQFCTPFDIEGQSQQQMNKQDEDEQDQEKEANKKSSESSKSNEEVEGFVFLEHLNNHDFQTLKHHFEDQIFTMSKKEYTMKINQIIQAINEKTYKKVSVMFEEEKQ